MSSRRFIARETPSPPRRNTVITHTDDGVPLLHPRLIPYGARSGSTASSSSHARAVASSSRSAIASSSRSGGASSATSGSALLPPASASAPAPSSQDALSGRKKRTFGEIMDAERRSPPPLPAPRPKKKPTSVPRRKEERPPPQTLPAGVFKAPAERRPTRLPNPGVAAIEASLPPPPPPRVIPEAGPPRRYRYAPEVRRKLGFDPLEKAKWRGGEEERVPIAGAENLIARHGPEGRNLPPPLLRLAAGRRKWVNVRKPGTDPLAPPSGEAEREGSPASSVSSLEIEWDEWDADSCGEDETPLQKLARVEMAEKMRPEMERRRKARAEAARIERIMKEIEEMSDMDD